MIMNKENNLVLLERENGWYGGYVFRDGKYEQVFNTDNKFLFLDIKKYTDMGYSITCLDKSKEAEFMKGRTTLLEYISNIEALNGEDINEDDLNLAARIVTEMQERQSDDGVTKVSSPIKIITKEQIEAGIDNGKIRFIVDPNMQQGTVCSIGEYWFYFGRIEDDDFHPDEWNPDEYIQQAPKDEIVDAVFTALDEMRSEGYLKDEYEYYADILS